MLSLIMEGPLVAGATAPRLSELTAALVQEHRLIDALRQALLRQRAGVVADDAVLIDGSIHVIGRTLLTLRESRRRRTSLTAVVAGQPGVALIDLELIVGALPASLVAAREAVRRAAEATAHDVAINQAVLRDALEASDTFLQQLFASAADPLPVAAPGPRPAARRGRALPLPGSGR